MTVARLATARERGGTAGAGLRGLRRRLTSRERSQGAKRRPQPQALAAKSVTVE